MIRDDQSYKFFISFLSSPIKNSLETIGCKCKLILKILSKGEVLMSAGYAGGGFALVVVLFILLIIVGASWYGGGVGGY